MRFLSLVFTTVQALSWMENQGLMPNLFPYSMADMPPLNTYTISFSVKYKSTRPSTTAFFYKFTHVKPVLKPISYFNSCVDLEVVSKNVRTSRDTVPLMLLISGTKQIPGPSIREERV